MHDTTPTPTDNLIWQWQSFDQIDPHDWYTITAARVAIFVVEQQCPYQELDGQDFDAHHLSLWNTQHELLGYLRVLGPGQRFAGPSIGRVLTTAGARGHGLGRPLMQRGIEYCQQQYPDQAIMLSAQHHLQAFYASLGFSSRGDMYLEDDIPHIDMVLNCGNAAHGDS